MIIGVAGKIASGKSTLARAIAARLKGRRVGFGDYVRSVAEARHLNSSDRTVLQMLGQELVTHDPRAFVREVFSFGRHLPSETIVLDGVRHEAIWQEVRAVAAQTAEVSFLVFLSIPEGSRLMRLGARGVSHESAKLFDHHESESDLESRLRRVADLTLDVGLDQTTLVDKVAQFTRLK